MKDDKLPLTPDELFAERVARPLRTSESASATFEDSLIAAIRAEKPLRRVIPRGTQPASPAWWSAPLIRLTPIAALAMAAGIAAIAVFATRTVSRATAPAAPVITAATVHDTVTFVRFVFVGRAKSVALVGDFNGWGGDSTKLDQTKNGAWTASVPLRNGRHEYAFIVDGQHWVPDPLAPTSSDEFDANSSVIMVGT